MSRDPEIPPRLDWEAKLKISLAQLRRGYPLTDYQVIGIVVRVLQEQLNKILLARGEKPFSRGDK